MVIAYARDQDFIAIVGTRLSARSRLALAKTPLARKIHEKVPPNPVYPL